MYITCSSLGRNGNFGNQLFQYAAVLGLAEKYKLNPVLPECQLKDILTLPEQHSLSANDYKTFYYQQKNVGRVNETYNHVEEFHSNIVQCITHQPDIIDIFGYFQSPAYFPPRLSFLFKTKKLFPSINYLKSNNYLDESLVFAGIHVRRGDYIQLQDFHLPLSLDYYKKAIDRLQLQLQKEQIHYIVVSDDIEWCQNNLPKLDPKGKWLFPNFDKFNDFNLLRVLGNVIIANSTFSWWAAYMNYITFGDTNVITPKSWFGPKLSHNKVSDLYLPNWTIIE